MRILYVVHQFLPRHIAGTELYTSRLAHGIQERGHEVVVFSTEAYHGESQSIVREKEVDGLRVIEAVHNNTFPDFAGSYLDAEKEGQFAAVLDEVAPDVVHVQHLHQHSIRDIGIAKDRGLPVAYTLHEFWLMCVHHGWLVRPGYELCPGPQVDDCVRCAKTCMPAPASGVTDNDWRAAWLARERTLRAQLDRVDLFVSPSRFLRQRFVDAGWIAPGRILFSDNGLPACVAPAPRPNRDGPLRIGFLGTIAEWKGVHVLVEAFDLLALGTATLDLWGVLEYFPDYVERLRAMSSRDDLRFRGRFANERVSEILAGLDVLVVPSLWYENSPLTIHEAFQTGVPVVCSDIGGMAEFVEHEQNGLHFAVGDASALAAQLERLTEDRDLLARLRSGTPTFKSIAEDCADWDQRYARLVEGQKPS